MPDVLSPISIWRGYRQLYPVEAVGLFFLTFVSPIESVLNPLLLAQLIRNLKNQDTAGIKKVLLRIGLLNLATTILYNINFNISNNMELNIHAHAIQETMRYLFEVKRYDVEAVGNGELIITIRKFAQNISFYINRIRNTIIPSIFSIFAQAIYLLSVDKVLSLCIFGIASSVLTTLLVSAKHRSTDVETQIFEHMDDLLLNLETIVANAAYDRELSTLSDMAKDAREHRHGLLWDAMRRYGFMNFAVVIFSSIFVRRLYVGLVEEGKTAKATAAVTVLIETLNTTKHFLQVILDVFRARKTINNALTVFDNLSPPGENVKVESQGSEDSVDSLDYLDSLDSKDSGGSPSINAQGVSMWSLREFSNTFLPGTLTVIVGPNGSGKSTLLKILAGQIKPKAGSILLDGENIINVNESDVRRQIGYVSQSSTLFNRSLLENLTYSDPQMADLQERLRKLGVLDFVMQIGLDTEVGKQGKKLSGGQRKVLQIVRAMLDSPRVLLLDEPIVGLDEYNADLILDMISSFRQNGATCVIATHEKRVEAIADNIIEL